MVMVVVVVVVVGVFQVGSAQCGCGCRLRVRVRMRMWVDGREIGSGTLGTSRARALFPNFRVSIDIM
jgi:hypothetical protein